MPGPGLSNPDSIFEKVNGYACKNPRQKCLGRGFSDHKRANICGPGLDVSLMTFVRKELIKQKVKSMR